MCLSSFVETIFPRRNHRQFSPSSSSKIICISSFLCVLIRTSTTIARPQMFGSLHGRMGVLNGSGCARVGSDCGHDARGFGGLEEDE